MAVAHDRGGVPAKLGVLLAAGASPWEPVALEALSGPGTLRLVKRCLDLPDLLATAASGTAQVAVVSAALAGLDADSVDRLARAGVRTVAISSPGPRPGGAEDLPGARVRLLRLGVARVVDEAVLDTLAHEVLELAEQGTVAGTATIGGRGGETALDVEPGVARSIAPDDGALDRGRLIAVWGATGAPGRTTVAIGIAAELAAAGRAVSLLDTDPYGGAVGQHLAVLDEVSGLLAAVRLANSGQLDRTRLVALAREVAPRLRLLTGLPRPDRWTELRPQALSQVLDTVRQLDDVVVADTGFGLPATPLDPFTAGPARDDATLTVLDEADDLVVVGSADPVGLTRLVRALRDVGEVRASGVDVVVVNRMRPSLGWSTREITDLVAQLVPRARLVFLPDDRVSVDRALVAGRTLIESGDGPLRRAMADVARSLL